MFLILDGLDELDGSDDACEELISLLINTARLIFLSYAYLAGPPHRCLHCRWSGFSRSRLHLVRYD